MSASSKPEKGGAPTIRRECTIARGRRKHVLGFLKGGRQGSVRCETADTPCREWADTPCREWPDTPCREWAEGSRHPLSGRTCTFELREGLHTTTTPSQIVIFNINCAEHTCLEAISWRGKLGAATWTASSSFRWPASRSLSFASHRTYQLIKEVLHSLLQCKILGPGQAFKLQLNMRRWSPSSGRASPQTPTSQLAINYYTAPI